MRWLSASWKTALLTAPGLLLFSVFVVFPVFYSLYYSFTNARGFQRSVLVGARNYRTLAADPTFWRAISNTAIVLVIAMVILVPLAFLLALLMQRRVPGGGVLRAVVFAPNILAPILIGLVWVFILDPKVGLLNSALRALALPSHTIWIGGLTFTPFSVSVVYVWSMLGFLMTIFYAGLQALPADVMEAASLDGASGIQRVRYVTIPLMRGTFAIVIALVFTGALRVFELVYALTGGGPVHVSEVLVSYMYYVTFTLQQYGEGMAIAVVVTALGAVGSIGYVLLIRDRDAA